VKVFVLLLMLFLTRSGVCILKTRQIQAGRGIIQGGLDTGTWERIWQSWW